MRMGLDVRRAYEGGKSFARVYIDAAASSLVHEVPAAGPDLDVVVLGKIENNLEAPVLRMAGCKYIAIRTHDFQRRIVHGPFKCLARNRYRVRG